MHTAILLSLYFFLLSMILLFTSLCNLKIYWCITGWRTDRAWNRHMFRRLMVDVAVSYGTCDSMGTLREIPESADISNLGLLCVPDWKLCRIDDFMYGFEQKLSGRKGISMIEIKDVSLNLNKRQILDHVSLKLQEGKIYGLVGNNGSGKTMLMKCVCGFIHPTSGMVLQMEK